METTRTVPTPGPREADLLKLLRNVRAKEGHKAHLTTICGTLVQLEAMPSKSASGWVRMFRLSRNGSPVWFGGGDWINQKQALAWARELDTRG